MEEKKQTGNECLRFPQSAAVFRSEEDSVSMCVLPPGKRQDLFKSELIPKVISEIEIKTQGGDQRLNECACV